MDKTVLLAITLFYSLLLTYQSQAFRKISFGGTGRIFNATAVGRSVRLGNFSHYRNFSGGGAQDTKNSKTNAIVPLALGITFIASYHLYKISKREDDPVHTHTGPLYLRFYASLPLRYLSQAWGYINSIVLPIPLRSPIYKTYAYLFNCDLSEVTQPLTFYQNLGEFFFREIDLKRRPISSEIVTAPSDGVIVNQGVITDGHIAQVKGITYSIDALLGPGHSALPSNGNNLYFAVIYLAPGDYHHFHSPVDWEVRKARQFQGEMFSVSPSLVERMNVFCVNERVSIEGRYKYGYCGMVAVAATNVGNLMLDFWKDLRTNHGHVKLGDWVGEVKVKESLAKGGHVGGFKLGSTVVVIWEGKGLKFKTEIGDRVKLGQGLSEDIY